MLYSLKFILMSRLINDDDDDDGRDISTAYSWFLLAYRIVKSQIHNSWSVLHFLLFLPPDEDQK